MDQGAKNRAQEDNQVKKLLLLGAGESGKSTLFKQMISIYGDGFTPEELKAHRKVVHNNTLNHIRILVQALDEIKEVQEELPLSDAGRQAIEAIDDYLESRLDPEIGGRRGRETINEGRIRGRAGSLPRRSRAAPAPSRTE